MEIETLPGYLPLLATTRAWREHFKANAAALVGADQVTADRAIARGSTDMGDISAR